ncbi:MAG: type IV toxin-antitoxin system AbiEi family antitoxin domain-containing protein [Sporichthyaceae bacterium]
MAVGLPAAMTRAPLRTFRPRDLTGSYAQPSEALHRLTRQGRVRTLAHGYYVAVPDDEGPLWHPQIEDIAAGVATAIYGERVPVLMHLTAARLHGAIPRAVGIALVAVPEQHDPIRLSGERGGTVRFVKRAVEQLDAVLRRIELGFALATTPEQTVLDLARRPALGGMEVEAREAVRALWSRCDQDRLDELAGVQRMAATLRRLRVQTRDRTAQ